MTHFFVIRAIERFTQKVALDLEELVKHHRFLTGETLIFSIIVPPTIKACVVVEAERRIDILPFLRELRQARGLFPGKLTLEEVYNMTQVPTEIYPAGTIVEIIAGPFKQCEGKIIDDDGSTVTLILLDVDYQNKIALRRSETRKKIS